MWILIDINTDFKATWLFTFEGFAPQTSSVLNCSSSHSHALLVILNKKYFIEGISIDWAIFQKTSQKSNANNQKMIKLIQFRHHDKLLKSMLDEIT